MPPGTTRPLTPATLDVLTTTRIDGTTLLITSGQLDRKVYAEVNKALELIGGKWNRRAQGHVFQSDPTAKLAEILETGRMPVDSDKLMSFWRTPAPVIEQLLDFIDLPEQGAGDCILEPSAGDGAIAKALTERFPLATISCVEPDEGRRLVLDEAGLWCSPMTFEEFAAEADDLGDRWDAIVMNPPFTTPGHPLAWAEHVTLAWDLLLPGGRLAAIVPASIEHSTRRPVAALRDLIGAHGSWEMHPDGAFRESGTGVRTALLTAVRP